MNKIKLPFVILLVGCFVLPPWWARAQQGRGQGVKPPVEAERRLALVIGNGNYADTPLTNPLNDARALTAALKAVGFHVLPGENLTQNEMKRAIRTFGEQLRAGGGVGLFFFAGHGVQAYGRNYLIPVGATITTLAEVEYEAVDAGLVLAQMEEAGNRLNLVILDACRNNPFRGLARTPERGLAQVRAPSGTLIAYATQPDNVAADGTGRNSPYTAELLRHLPTAGLKLEDFFKRVRAGVRQATANKQTPWEATSVDGDFYFIPPALPPPPAPLPTPAFDPAAVELALWQSAQRNDEISDYEEYLRQYPQGRFAVSARNRIARLRVPAVVTNPAPANPPPSNPAPSVRMSATGVALTALASFTTVKTDQTGKVIERKERQECWGYVEDLGNGVRLELVEIPAGEFQMGSNDGDGDEKPVHRVRLNGFLMSKYEVTQAQWRAVAKLPKVRIDLNLEPSRFKGDNLPVEQGSWDDAVEFCARLSRKTGGKYSLPSEAQWEYAARAGTTTPFAFGPTVTPELVNYKGNYPYGQAAKGQYRAQTTSVGSFPANAWGLFDMHGNVWEWCEDDWHDSYSAAPTDGRAWADLSARGSYRVIRGGGWFYIAVVCRSASRDYDAPDRRYDYVGFRLVRT